MRNLVLAGLTTHHCLYFTGIDASMRDFNLYVVSDAAVSLGAAEQREGIRNFEKVLKAKVLPLRRLKNQRGI